MNHVMIDLETLGTVPGSSILSIGAVQFDPFKEGLGEEFYCVIDRGSCLSAGLIEQESTLAWWSRQDPETRKEVFEPDAPTALIPSLRGLSNFIHKYQLIFPWSHGAGFDLVLLEAAYRACKLEVPWKFNNARDTRTVFAMAREKPDRTVGVHHHALDDARQQAKCVVSSFKRLGVPS